MPTSSRWVIPAPKKNLVVGVADMIASNDAGAELVTYSLGSCLGVTVYDPVKKNRRPASPHAAGIAHFPGEGRDRAVHVCGHGRAQLFKTFYNLGGDRSRALIRVAGGAQFLDDQRTFNIGERNIRAFEEIIARNGLVIHARDLGGFNSRTLRFDLATGNVSIHSPGCPPRQL